MLQDCVRGYSKERVEVQHGKEQVHEFLVFIESEAVVFLQTALNILDDCLLPSHYSFALTTLHPEQPSANDGLARLRLGSALEREPQREPTHDFEQNDAQRPDVIGPWLHHICQYQLLIVLVLQVFEHFRR